MVTTKPTKPTDLMPEQFAVSGVKNNFSSEKIQNGFSANFDDIFQGDNINYMLDSIGKQLKYLNTVVDYINAIGIKKVPYINANNQLDSGDINTLLPTQTNNSGKYLTTNGTSCSWASDFRVIGELVITLNFNYVLPNNCVWLDGTAGENHDGVVPITGDWAELFAIYGYQYDISYQGQNSFRLPNFSNRVIWGGNTAGYIEAGLPNITGRFCSTDDNNNSSTTGAFRAQSATGINGTGGYSPEKVITFDASRSSSLYGKSSTVQPAAIKARVYTRYK